MCVPKSLGLSKEASHMEHGNVAILEAGSDFFEIFKNQKLFEMEADDYEGERASDNPQLLTKRRVVSKYNM